MMKPNGGAWMASEVTTLRKWDRLHCAPHYVAPEGAAQHRRLRPHAMAGARPHAAGCGADVECGSVTTAIVCGGRNYRNKVRVYQILDAARERLGVDFIVQGVADGADYLAWQWADERKVQCGSYPADWKAHGKGAGPKRNARMLANSSASLVIAFPGGNGTADMVAKAEAAGVRVIKVDWL